MDEFCRAKFEIIEQILLQPEYMIYKPSFDMFLDKYNMLIAPLIIDADRNAEQICQVIKNLCVETFIDGIIAFVRTATKPAIVDLVRKYDNLRPYEFKEQSFRKCRECNEAYTINESCSALTCVGCGHIVILDGTALDDQGCDPNLTPSKSPYKKSVIGHKWLIYLQAAEDIEYPVGFIENIKRQLYNNRIFRKHFITDEVIRTCLKKIPSGTDYNCHVPHIIKTITGNVPDMLTEQEMDSIEEDLAVVIKIIGLLEDGNSPYLPYLIMRIIEQKLPEKEISEKRRKSNILKYFHVQTDTTLKSKDQVWAKVCEKYTKFTYSACDIDAYLKYVDY